MTRVFQHVYGPVPSRRLGRSLGVDLVPRKTCTYDCIYCQLGSTTCRTLARKNYVPVAEVLEELAARLTEDPAPDAIGLAGSGEPTLHRGLGELVRGIKALTRVPVAVITNGSLLWQPEVRASLQEADVVLPSLDAYDASSFQRINRPHEGLAFERMVEGLVDFSRDFRGEVWLELFLLAGVNDGNACMEGFRDLVRRIAPTRVQLNTVARPPAEAGLRGVSAARLAELALCLPGRVEVIQEGDPGSGEGGDAGQGEVLGLLARRPCTLEGLARGLASSPLGVLKHLDRLLAEGRVEVSREAGQLFYRIPMDGGCA